MQDAGRRLAIQLRVKEGPAVVDTLRIHILFPINHGGVLFQQLIWRQNKQSNNPDFNPNYHCHPLTTIRHYREVS